MFNKKNKNIITITTLSMLNLKIGEIECKLLEN